jgi:hypothetical protein
LFSFLRFTMESKRQSVILMVLCGEDHELKGLSARYSKKVIFTTLWTHQKKTVMTPPKLISAALFLLH